MSVIDDAYERLQKMLGDTEKVKVVLPNFTFDKYDKPAIKKVIAAKIVKHANAPEHTADLITDHIMEIMAEYMVMKASQAYKKELERHETPESGKETPMTGKSEKSLFKRVQE